MKEKKSQAGISNFNSIKLMPIILFLIAASINAFAAKDFIVENKTSALFIINGTTGNVILTPSFGLVGIGTINPINALTVIGSVSAFGSLNATFINATEIRIGNNLIPTSGAFNNANYTALEDAAFRISNFTTQLNNYIPLFFNNENFTNLKPFTLTNYSAEYALSGFKLSNFTTAYDSRADRFGNVNYTSLENAAFTNANASNLNTSLWNLSRNLFVYLKDAAYLVRIGDVNRNISNDTFAVIGSAAVYGSLNATSFNSSFILQNNNQVQTVNAVFNIGNYSSEYAGSGFKITNYTALENAAFTNTNYTYLEAAAFTKANYSAEYASTGFKNANYTTLEDSAFRLANFTTNYEAQAYFKIANYTALQNAAFTLANHSAEYASTGYKLANFTSNLNAQNSSLWNRSSASTYLKFIDDLVGIGTITPDNRLTIRGTDTDANLAGQPGLLHLNITDSYNKSTTNLITLDHNLNNPANSTGGIGIGILFRAVNNDSELVNVSFINASLVNAINGSEASALSFYTRTSNGLLTPKLILNGSDVFIAPTGGNVGIGTTAPDRTLTVNATNANTVGLDVLGYYGTGQSGVYLQNSLNNGMFLSLTNSAGATTHLFRSYGDSYINSGNVGIGTTAPLSTLHINASGDSGGLRITNSSTNYTVFFVNSTSGFVGIGTATSGIPLHIASGGNAIVRIQRLGDGAAAALGFMNSTAEKWGIGMRSSTNQFRIFEDGSTANARLVIDSGGNIGVNTTTPGSALTVVGTLNVSRSTSAGDLYVDNNGNVGIGTTGPDGKLHVMTASAGSITANVNLDDLTVENSAAGGISILVPDSTNAFLGFGSPTATGGDNYLLWNQNAGSEYFQLRAGGTDVIRIQDNGNVGIGTTSPTAKLHVSGDLNVTTQALFTTQNSTNNVGIGTMNPTEKFQVRKDVSNGDSSVFRGDNAAGGSGLTGETASLNLILGSGSGNTVGGVSIRAGKIGDMVASGDRDAYLSFWTLNNDAIGERMRIDNVGNVGIGTTVPGQKLTVVGDVNVSGSLNVSGGGILVKSTTSDGIIAIDGSESSQLEFNRNGGLLWRLQRLTSTDDLYLRSGGGTREVMFWNNANGNVGIGTTVPDYLLTTAKATAGKDVNLSGVLYVNGSSGRVGIGTTTPNATLHIERTLSGGIGPILAIKNGAADATNQGGEIDFLNAAGNNVATAFARIRSFQLSGSTGESVLTFHTHNGVTEAERVRIGSTGNLTVDTSTLFVDADANNVGIGTTGPSQKLDVVGAGQFSTQLAVGTSIASNVQSYQTGTFAPAAASVRALEVDTTLKPNAAGTAYGFFTTPTADATNGVISDFYGIAVGTLTKSAGTVTNAYGIYTTVPTAGTNNYALYTEGKTVLSATTGNVGIGTTTPASKLDVQAAASATNVSRVLRSTGAPMWMVDLGGDDNPIMRMYNSNGVESTRIAANSFSYFNGGNFGLGTETPAEKLSVNGNVSIEGTNCRDSGGSATCNNFVDIAELFEASEEVSSGDIVVINFQDSSMLSAKNHLSTLAQPNSPQNPKSTHNSFQNPRPEQFQNARPTDFQYPRPGSSNIRDQEFQNQVPAQLKNPQNTTLSFGIENNADEISEETQNFKIKKSSQPYDKKAVGVVSTQPAIVIEGGRIVAMGGWKGQNNTLKPAVALAGRVPVKATDENGPIAKGDLLTSSSKPGYAMKCEVFEINDNDDFAALKSKTKNNEKCRNSIIGKAMEPLEAGEGKILMFISTQ